MSLKKRSFAIAGHRTSVALEDEFWAVFDEMVANRRVSQAELVTEIDTARGDQNLASAIRVKCLQWARSNPKG